MKLVTTITGAEPVIRRYRGVGQRAGDARPLWDVLESRFVRAEAIQFSSQGHGAWAPLSPAYAAWKAVHYPGKRLLQATGDLFHSLVDDLAISVKEPSFAVFGTDDPKARFHQDGTSTMPARPVIDFSDAELRTWSEVARNWLLEGTAETRAA